MKGRTQNQIHWIIKFSDNNNVVVFFISLLFFIPFSCAQSTNNGTSSDTYILQSNQFRFSPVLGIVLFCLITAFFVMGFLSVYARHCFESRTGNDYTINRAYRYPRRTFTPGLEPGLIDKFPTFLYSDVKGHKIGKAALECAVCLNEFEDGETLRLLPKCCHVFHPHCIDAWLALHVTCPVCRANLIPVAGEESESNYVLSSDVETESTHSTQPPEAQYQVGDVNELAVVIDISSPEVVKASKTTNENRPPRLILEKSKVEPKFSRSHSTGHSMVQPCEDRERFTLRLPEELQKKDRERFTLRLPEELQKKLMQPELRKANGSMAFPSARSSKKGFRSNSFGTGRERNNNHAYYERFDREGRQGRQGFTVTPPFISRTGSSNSLTDGDSSNKSTTSAGLLKSVKAPFDRLFGSIEKDDLGKGRLLG